MAALFGALVGAGLNVILFVLLLLLGFFSPGILVIAPLSIIWPIVGALLAAAITGKLRGRHGFGMGAFSGCLSSVVTCIGYLVTTIVVAAIIMSSMSSYVIRAWPHVREHLTEERVEAMDLNIPNPELEGQVRSLLIGLGRHEDPKEAFAELQSWITDERIDGLAEALKPDDIDTFRTRMTDLKTMEFDEAMNLLSTFLSAMVVGMGIFGSFFAVFAAMALCFCGVVAGGFGGFILGVFFPAAQPQPPPAHTGPGFTSPERTPPSPPPSSTPPQDPPSS